MIGHCRRGMRKARRSIASSTAPAMSAAPTRRNCVTCAGVRPASMMSFVTLPFAPNSTAASSA